MDAGAGLWTAAPALASLRWRRYEDAWFAYDPRSGQTHFLNRAAVSVLDLLRAGPRSLREVESALCAAHAAEPDPELASVLEDTVRVMDALGLVAPLPSA